MTRTGFDGQASVCAAQGLAANAVNMSAVVNARSVVSFFTRFLLCAPAAAQS
jgi:hypothetical protein